MQLDVWEVTVAANVQDFTRRLECPAWKLLSGLSMFACDDTLIWHS